MPRFSSNRWLAFILTIIALHVVGLSLVAKSSAETRRYSVWVPGSDDGTLGGLPPPAGVGDPDQPVNTRLKYSARGSLGGGGAVAMNRTAGDRRVVVGVWMNRLLVMERLLRSYLYRF